MKSFAGLAASLFLTACHPGGVKLTGTVTVPVEVQRLFSMTQPGRVVVYGEPTDGGGWFAQRTVRYLCEPSTEPLVLPIDIEDDYACAVEAMVRADIDPVPEPVRSRVRCGEQDDITGSFRKDNVVSTGSQKVFEGKGRGTCDEGTATVDIRIAAVPGS